MELKNVIETRRSIRRYQEKPVEREKLVKMAEMMRLAPSAVNRQEWKFIFVESKALIAKISEATGFPWLMKAPVILAACGTDCGMMTNSHRSDTIDTSIAAAFGMLEATELGLGTTWMAHYEEDRIKAILELPESMSVVCLMSIGYPAEEGIEHRRKPLNEITEFRS